VAHKRELRRRLRTLAERLGVSTPDQLAGQLAVLVNGAFVSSTLLSAEEAVPLLRGAAHALVTAAGQRP
jgi:uncharacterized protein (DUF2267 family)